MNHRTTAFNVAFDNAFGYYFNDHDYDNVICTKWFRLTVRNAFLFAVWETLYIRPFNFQQSITWLFFAR